MEALKNIHDDYDWDIKSRKNGQINNEIPGWQTHFEKIYDIDAVTSSSDPSLACLIMRS